MIPAVCLQQAYTEDQVTVSFLSICIDFINAVRRMVPLDFQFLLPFLRADDNKYLMNQRI